MEYQFSHDTTSGNFRAKFNTEHQVFGQWLETEIGSNQANLSKVLKMLDGVAHTHQQDIKYVGHQYTLVLSNEDAIIALNASLEGEEMSENLAEQALEFDETESAMCGIDDFHQLMLAWANFLTK
ncbi:YacL family protein [Thalassotalea sp. LPB0316]|uniref:UPF0231 family protein n=1 Tax=Thalassotalea sp. LPB0316 TaxID=2769490 RepID=UPI001866A9BE|nr:YacL family protein [Thalassotalea sp. LPB0316]QOL26778.1 YacL family protein [Thalassotalea sp. LPB0316]